MGHADDVTKYAKAAISHMEMAQAETDNPHLGERLSHRKEAVDHGN